MAEESNWTPKDPSCKWMKSKQIYMGLDFHPSGNEESIGTPCWCTRTHLALGPDGEIASVSDCVASRACFESVA